MNSTQKWSVSAGLIAVLLIIASWFLLVSPKRSDTAALKQQTVAQEATNTETRAKTDLLRAQAVDLPAQKATIAAFHRRVPADPALPTLVRTMTKIAKASAVDLKSIAPSVPAPLESPKAADVSAITVALNVSGDYFAVQNFLQRVESLDRVMLVTNIVLAPDTAVVEGSSSATPVSGKVTANISARVFMTAPVAAAAPAVAAAAVPAATTQPAAK